MSLVLSWGRWGGFYIYRGYTKRICLGWVALTFVPEEFEDLCERLRKEGNLLRLARERMEE